MENKYYICETCCKEKYLKHYIRGLEKERAKCSICQDEKECAKINEKVRNVVRAAIRFYYNEFAYRYKGAEELLKNENIIIEAFKKINVDENSIVDEEIKIREISVKRTKEQIIESLKNEYMDEVLDKLVGWGDVNQDIYLYNGHSGDSKDYYWQSLNEEQSERWFNIRKSIYKFNYYVVEEELLKILKPLAPKLEREIKENTIYYRARIGSEEKVIIKDLDEEDKIWNGIKGYLYEEDFMKKYPDCDYKDDYTICLCPVKEAYSTDGIGAPPNKCATAGRINRACISYLYLATDTETSVCEMKPTPGQYISLGAFKVKRSLKVIDLSFIDLAKFCDEDSALNDFRLLLDIKEEFLKPAVPEDTNPYIITQTISEVIRCLGYDGIMYESAIANGINIAIFNPEYCDYINGTEQLIKIEKMKYTYRKVKYEELDELAGIVDEKLE